VTAYRGDQAVFKGPLECLFGGHYTYSWRVPLTILGGPLRFVASWDLGGLGPSESESATIQWQWYYHPPGFAGWMLIGVLLVLVKDNRSRQAWTILIPFLLLTEIVWPMARFLWPVLLGQQQDLLFQALVTAWTALWLVSPWLARCRPAAAIVLVLGLAATLGVVAQLGVYRRLDSGPFLPGYSALILALVLAFVLCGVSCRKTFRPGRFLAWLLLWLPLGVGLGIGCTFAWWNWHAAHSSWWDLHLLYFILSQFALWSLCIAGILYVVNLPFMYLAFRCPPYWDRFHRLLRLPTRPPPTTDD